MKTWRIAATLGAAGVAALSLGGGSDWLPRLSSSAHPATSNAKLPAWAGRQTEAGAIGSLPVQFVENRGQVGAQARFVVGWPHAPAWISSTGLMLQVARADEPSAPPRCRRDVEADGARAATAVHGAHVALIFEGAATDATVESVENSPTRYSYFLGNDPARWVKGVASSRRLRWNGLYPGITVELHGGRGQLEYDVRVEPGADLAQFVVRVEGAAGLAVEPDGSLRIDTAGGSIHQGVPPTWQVDPGGNQRLFACNYRLLDEQRYGFVLGDHDSGRPVVIDPELQFGTFLGGQGGADECYGIAVDQSGSPCLVGSTSSVDFPVTLGAFDTTIGAFKPDGFVAKLSAAGDSLLWATYLGGNSSLDAPRHIAVASNGDLTVAGNTGSTDFPTTPSGFDTTLGGDTDAYIARLLADGSELVFATLIGGGDDDAVRGMAVDNLDRACFAGMTRSPDFPVTPGAFDPTINPAQLDGMLGRLSTDGSTLDYATYIPGASNTQCLALDSLGHPCVGGGVSSGFITTPGAYQAGQDGEFVYKFDFATGAFVYSSQFGGAGLDFLEAIAVDAAGAAYVTGTTDSQDFPTTSGAYDTTINGTDDAFIAKLSPDGTTLEFGTYFGGSSGDTSLAIALDAQGSLMISGRTFSVNLPVTADAFSQQLSRGDGAFCAQLSADGSELIYGTYFGGTTLWEFPLCIALDLLGDAYVVGYTHAPDFPTTPSSFMPSYGPGNNNQGFILKFAFGPWTNMGQALAGLNGSVPTLLGDGTLEPGSAGSITLTGAKPSAPAFLIVGLTALLAPFKAGTMVPNPQMIFPLATSAAGGKFLSWATWPAGLPSGAELLMQYWIVDAGGPAGFSASNGLSAVVP